MKIILLILITTLSLPSFSSEKKVVFLISQGFYAPEYYKPLKIFKEAGIKVTTAAKYKIPIQPDRRQIGEYSAVTPDISFDEINPVEYDGIVFAGGNGAWEDFFPNQTVHKKLTAFMEAGKLTALLCSSVGLLGVANNLDGISKPLAEGRKVTGYKRVEGLLTQLGKVNFRKGDKDLPYVVVDGNLITGRDPMSSELFAKTIVRELGNSIHHPRHRQ